MGKKIGTSPFTHQDDAIADVHTTNPMHTEAHVYGGNAPEKNEEATVVLGPPAFGSPDVRTLGHVMNPDMKSPSAPALDSEFSALQAVAGGGGEFTEEELNQMNKQELLSFAEQAGVEVNSSMKKQEIIDAIAEEYEISDSDASAEEGTADDESGDEVGGEQDEDVPGDDIQPQ